MEREELKALIVDTVSGAGGLLRRKQIATMLGYAKSPHIVGVLEELATDDGPLAKQVGSFRGHDCWLYGLRSDMPCLL